MRNGRFLMTIEYRPAWTFEYQINENQTLKKNLSLGLRAISLKLDSPIWIPELYIRKQDSVLELEVSGIFMVRLS